MALSLCWFAVHLPDEGLRSVMEQRLRRLTGYYAPIGASAPAVQWRRQGRLMLGYLSLEPLEGAEAPHDPHDGSLMVFGEPLPSGLDNAAALITASDQQLRQLDGAGAAAAFMEDRVCIITYCGGPSMLYAAEAEGTTAWATHAVAAAFLASGRAELDGEALPELVATEFVGDERTVIKDARAVPAATRVDIDGHGRPRARSYWPDAERWAPLPAPEASAAAERALLQSLDARLSRLRSPVLGLTAGLDSRVVALALRELDVPFRAFTWTAAAAEDTAGAAAVARELGVSHEALDVRRHGDEQGLRTMLAEVRWGEALGQLGPWGTQPWPACVGALVTGRGGEAGRAFYYRDRVGRRGPDLPELVGALPFDAYLAGADPAARARLRRRVRGWVEDAQALGYRGWPCLDVLYARQRQRRWGRESVSRIATSYVPALDTPDVARALCSLPLSDLLSDGFHRRFIASRSQALAVPAPTAGRTPGALERGFIRFRRSAGRLRHRRAPRSSWPLAALWGDYPLSREWFADTLTRPIVRDALGETWAAQTRRGFLADERHATQRTLRLARPIALQAALADLSQVTPSSAATAPGV